VNDRHRCIVCRRIIRPSNRKADRLYLTQAGEVWVCGPTCALSYNEGEPEDAIGTSLRLHRG